MPKSSDESLPSETDARAAVVQGMQPLFNIDDRVAVQTLAGAKFDGVVEDANLVGILVRTDEDRLFFVGYTSMDHSEIFEDGGEGDGDRADEPEAAGEAPAAGGAPVTSIGRSAA